MDCHGGLPMKALIRAIATCSGSPYCPTCIPGCWPRMAERFLAGRHLGNGETAVAEVTTLLIAAGARETAYRALGEYAKMLREHG